MLGYTIGIDFGTLSGRAVLVDVQTGLELSTCTWPYAHGVMEQVFLDGTPLETGWALQDPRDYLDVLDHVIPGVIQKANIPESLVLGIGIDFTSCTILPVYSDGTPLCFHEKYRTTPHAYAKLWKHHAAQKQTNRINRLIKRRQETWISWYGGKISSEWQLPKILQILEDAPEVYYDADYFVEAGDWITWYLTGNLYKSTCAAGYKGLYADDAGYPDPSFFLALNPSLSSLVQQKLNYPLARLGTRIGTLRKPLADSWGFSVCPAVPAACIDAHAILPAVQVTEPGTVVSVLGTSACHILISPQKRPIQGISGVVKDGIYPGFYAYEAGQSCFGDHFSWLLEQAVPEHVVQAAGRLNLDLHHYLQHLAQRLQPGESGLLALDWWNGNRSILSDDKLSGLLLGLTLQTRPEEIYLTLLEAVAFGAKKIITAYQNNGIEISQIVAAGGVSQKNDLLMQIYSDVMQLPVYVSDSAECAAAGSAIFAAAAAGAYPSVRDAARTMGKRGSKLFCAIPSRSNVYQQLFQEYSTLHDYFGQGGNDVMKHLKELQVHARRSGLSRH